MLDKLLPVGGSATVARDGRANVPSGDRLVSVRKLGSNDNRIHTNHELCIYVYIYTYIHIYTSICMYIYIYIHIYIYIYIEREMCIYVQVFRHRQNAYLAQRT